MFWKEFQKFFIVIVTRKNDLTDLGQKEEAIVIAAVTAANFIVQVSDSLTCKIPKNDIFFHKSQKFFFVFVGDESPNVHD